MALNLNLQRLSQETSPSVLFPRPPVVQFRPEREICHCGRRLVVQKTRCKKVLTMTGPFIAHETVAQCSVCSRVFHSDTLLRLVGSRCNVAYDVLVFVGQALFRRHRNSQEVRAELIARNVRLSISEIEYLGRKFITYLAMAHRQATPRICQAMKLAGGYVLHLDATHEGEAPALMTGMDSLSDIVLANMKVPGEKVDHVIPFLRKLQADYGNPTACVHDMGGAILKAVAEVFPGIPDFICHFHFLRDIGKDFLEPAYGILRRCLRFHAISTRLRELAQETRDCLVEQGLKCPTLAKAIKDANPADDTGPVQEACTYSLALWVLNGKHSGDGYGFPFDRPMFDFAKRLLELHHRLPELLDALLTDQSPYSQPIYKLAFAVSRVGNDPVLCQAVEELRWRTPVFDRLREAMRIASVNGGDGLKDEGADADMSTIRQGVAKFRQEIETDPKLAGDYLCNKMAEQIDKYDEKLFADPIGVDTPNGPITVYPQRTNNILERFFRDRRRAYRRRTGNDSMCRNLQAMLADTPLVKNLDNPGYMKILLDGKDSLEELFASLGAANLAGPEDLHANTNCILPGFRHLMKLPTLPDQIVRSLKQTAKTAESNRILGP